MTETQRRHFKMAGDLLNRRLRQPLSRAAHSVRQKANDLTPAPVKYILLGPSDQNGRRWLRDEEIKSLLGEASKDYQPTFFEEEGLWRSRRGFFRLWQGDDGTKSMVFGHAASDLEVEAVAGGRLVLKHPKKVFLVTPWPRKTPAGVHLADITRAIDMYTHEVDTGIRDAGVLYLTDVEKGIYRSGGMAYVLKMEGGFVRHIIFYSDPTETHRLANPFGRKWYERAFQRLMPGVDLLPLLDHGAEKGQAGQIKRQFPWKRRAAPPPVYKLTREEAEDLICRHFQGAVNRYIHGLDPASDEDKKWHRAYFYITRPWLFGLAGFRGAQIRIRKLDLTKGPAFTKLVGGIFTAIKSVLTGFLPFALWGLWNSIVGVLGIFKRSPLDANALVDLHDPLVQKLSKDSGTIGAFRTTMRPINAEAFAKGTFLKTPTFDDVIPDVKREKIFRCGPPTALNPPYWNVWGHS